VIRGGVYRERVIVKTSGIWFDVKDNRHWPASSAPTNQPATAATVKPTDIAGAYGAETSEGQPQGLTLEKLRLRFEDNVYFAAPGQGWFTWGPTWARHKTCASLREFRSDLGIDVNGQSLDPGFADMLQLDFRLRAETMALVKESYPQGPVPGVMLGVIY